ncbi:zinc finger BED domain-containing protein 1-like [Rhizophagus clarus]|uniref:Zinc finger BED domain-containing protein 1-like n=1 Tax=Rhizophagus clarus TaxID=94130 RepID=A0A8H3QFG6_9GLOM|nr:zinc finger BED domain-containing protein 1-like [Rhizophagus clarus]
MTEEINPLTPLSDHDSEEEEIEGSNQTASRPSNKLWKWWEPVLLDNGNTGAECLVKITDEQLCGKLYLNENSTSNLIMHLAGSHKITENTDLKGKSVQTTLTNKILLHNETKQVQLRQSLVDWFIADSMLLKLVQSEMFKKFLHDLDPDENFQLHELVLAVTYVRYPHTADHISDTLLELLDHWLLREKVNVITTDNGSNIKKAIKDMNEISSNITWQPCTAHTLQLVNPGKTSTYLRHCITDVATWWNSSFLAWKRLLEVKPYIDILSTTLSIANDADSKRDGERLSEIILTKDEWELLRDLCEVLKGFAEATTYLGASKYVTHSIMSPLLKEIKKRVKPENTSLQNVDIEEIVDVFSKEEEGKMAERENRQSASGRLNLNVPFNTTGMLEKVKLHLYNAMELYWNKEEEETLISALLDPRIKSLGFVDNEEVCNKTKDLLKNKYDQLKANSSLTASTTPATLSSGQSSLFSIFKQNSSQDDELTTYLSLPELDFDLDPFIWYDRLFSDAGNLLTAKRTRLNPELFNRLMFLKKNASFVKSIHPSTKNL